MFGARDDRAMPVHWALAAALIATAVGSAVGACGRRGRSTTPVPSTAVHTDSRFQAPPGETSVIVVADAPSGECTLLATLVGESSWWSVEEEGNAPASGAASNYAVEARADARQKAYALGATHVVLGEPELENRYLDVVSIRISGTAYRCPLPVAGPPAP